MNITRRKYPLFITFILFTTYLIFVDLVDGNWASLENSLDNLSRFFRESLWPPNWKVIEARSYPTCERNWDFLCSPAYIGIMETLKIAFVSTGFGFIISLCSIIERIVFTKDGCRMQYLSSQIFS